MTASDAPKEIAAAVAEAMKVNTSVLADAKVVEVAADRRDDRGWPSFILAARLTGFQFKGDEIGTWATGDRGDAPVLALNPIAREHTQWGDGAPRDPGEETTSKLAGSPEAAEAQRAVGG